MLFCILIFAFNFKLLENINTSFLVNRLFRAASGVIF
jgi:hypothetical protein